MVDRKELKRKARINYKKHIVFFVIICAISVFIGAEFKGSFLLSIVNENHTFETIISNINEKGFEQTESEINDYMQEEKNSETDIIGRTNGIFAMSINAIRSGSLYIVGISALRNIAKSSTVLLVITIIAALVLYFAFWFYIVNIFEVIIRRIFLEGITYKKVPYRRIAFLSKTKRWNKVSRAMFRRIIYQGLWNITIIGGFIKHYSYLMVPYILAENPDINGKEAIKLSRMMMYGHKLEAFIIDLSFIGWDLFGILTYGISNVLYLNPYKVATFAEFYKELRMLAKNKKIENAELLNDKYLYELADSNLIDEKYKDILEIMNQEDYIYNKKKGMKYFIYEFLGIHGYTEDEKKYENQKLKEFVIDEFAPVITKEAYPFRLFTIESKDTKYAIESLNYMRHYSLNSLIYIFFIVSFIGWLWEVMLYLVNDGIFVNRGTFHGPWLPIYGGGSLIILLFLSKFRKNMLLEFFLAIVLCGFVEYFTAYYLELTHDGTKWWDYSGYFLNLHGRICAEGLLTFGFGGIAMVYYIAPAIDDKIRILNKKVLGIVAIVLITIFTIDAVYSHNVPNSGRGINDYSVQKQLKTKQLKV